MLHFQKIHCCELDWEIEVFSKFLAKSSLPAGHTRAALYITCTQVNFSDMQMKTWDLLLGLAVHDCPLPFLTSQSKVAVTVKDWNRKVQGSNSYSDNGAL